MQSWMVIVHACWCDSVTGSGKSRDIVRESAHEAIEILKNDGLITGGDVTETTVEGTRH